MRKFLLIALSLLSSCVLITPSRENTGWLEGTIVFEKGNQMPSAVNTHRIKGKVQKDVYIYELTNVDSVIKEGRFYTSIDSKLVSKVKTSKNGNFKTKLEEGYYSILTREKNGFYVSEFDKYNNLHPILIKSGETTNVSILINYEAFY